MDVQPHQETADNPSQHRAGRAADQAAFGSTPQSAMIRTIVFIVLFVVGFGTLFYFLNG
jgi:hypothetical protein